jgi:hypothetical protein
MPTLKRTRELLTEGQARKLGQVGGGGGGEGDASNVFSVVAVAITAKQAGRIALSIIMLLPVFAVIFCSRLQEICLKIQWK